MANARRVLMLAAWVQLLLVAPAALAAQPPVAATVPAAKAETKPLPASVSGGYRLQKIKGEMVYCRTVTPTGTTLPRKECFTPDAIAEMQRLGQAQRDGLLQHLPICGNANSACVSN